MTYYLIRSIIMSIVNMGGEMSVPVRCEECRDVIGVRIARVHHHSRGGYYPNASCKGTGTHKKPERTVRRGIVVNMTTITYENGSVSRFPVYVDPSSILGRIFKRTLLFIYVKVLHNDVFLEKEGKWLFA